MLFIVFTGVTFNCHPLGSGFMMWGKGGMGGSDLPLQHQTSVTCFQMQLFGEHASCGIYRASGLETRPVLSEGQMMADVFMLRIPVKLKCQTESNTCLTAIFTHGFSGNTKKQLDAQAGGCFRHRFTLVFGFLKIFLQSRGTYAARYRLALHI